MRVYSFQPNIIVEKLLNGEEHICDGSKSPLIMEDEFDRPYQWLVKQMNKRLGNPENIEYPVWVWVKADENKSRPDRRKRMFNNIGKDYSMLELEIDSSRILQSDFETWHYVLNNDVYMSYSDQLRMGELSDEEWNKEYDLLEAYSQDEKEKTWDGVFDLRESAYIQGTLWKILPTDIVKVHKIK